MQAPSQLPGNDRKALTPTFPRTLKLVLMVMVPLVCVPLPAGETLPLDGQQASPTEQQAYQDMLAMQYRKEKRETGQRRYERRMRKKASIASAMRQQADIRRQRSAQLSRNFSADAPDVGLKPAAKSQGAGYLIASGLALLGLAGYEVHRRRHSIPEQMNVER